MANETAFSESLGAINQTSCHQLECTDWQGLLNAPSWPYSETLVVTRKTLAELRKLPTQTSFSCPFSLAGTELRVVDFPLTKRIPKSLDRFAEYNEKDIEWAEPAGLAKWIDVDVDAMMIRVRDNMVGQFLMESST